MRLIESSVADSSRDDVNYQNIKATNSISDDDGNTTTSLAIVNKNERLLSETLRPGT
jgi:hypothetical protein